MSVLRFGTNSYENLDRIDPSNRDDDICELTYEDPNFLEKMIWKDESKFSNERRFQEIFSLNMFYLLMNNKWKLEL